jgi:multidrug efflux pump subunit AcrB
MNQQPATGLKGFIYLLATHGVAANLLMVLFFLIGAWSLTKLTTQMFPTFEIDVITVEVTWRGAAAEDVQESIVIPIERELKNVANVKEIYSKSSIGVATIRVEVEEGTDVSLVLDDVKQYVGNIRNLPQESEKPEINRVVRYDRVAKLLIETTGQLEALRPIVKQYERQLLNLGIDKVEISGLPTQEVRIEVPVESLHQAGMSFSEISQQVQSESTDLPAGTLGHNDGSKLVRSINKQQLDHGFEELPIHTPSGSTVHLGDIAFVNRVQTEDAPYQTSAGKAVVSMDLYRTEKEDSLKIAAIINEWLEETQGQLPEGMTITAYEEFWRYLQDRIDLLLKNGLSGLVLVIGILFLFLNSRVAFWVAVGIPISFMGALTILYFTGGSINMISLFAFIMALGIIVDDAIVVGEDALSHYEQGESAQGAAIGGANRMLAPVTSSSITTICAFLPLLMIGGVIGSILKDIPIIVICVILASLLECFLILPGHLSHSMRREDKAHPDKINHWRKRFDHAFDHFRDQTFKSLVTKALNNRRITVSIILATFVIAISAIKTGHLKFVFFPKIDGNIVITNMEFHPNANAAEKKQYQYDVEAAIRTSLHELGHSEQHVNTLISYHNRQINLQEGPSNVGIGENFGSVVVEFVDESERNFNLTQFINMLQKQLPESGVVRDITVDKQQSGPRGKPITFKFSGTDVLQIKQASLELQDALRSYNGVYNIADDLPFGQEQLIFTPTVQAQSLGLSTRYIGSQLRDAIDGRLVQIFNEYDEEIEVRVMLPSQQKRTLSTLESFPIVLPDGTTAPLSNLVKFESRVGMDILRRVGGELAVIITADVDTQKANADEVMDDLREKYIAKIQQKYNVSVGLEGLSKEQQETMRDMGFGALIAIVLIYIVLAWVFESYSWPLAIMAAIPFGITGALYGHMLLGIDVTILSLFGLFALSGIVINDSIVLITFYKELKARGIAIQEAIIQATCLRLRAVLLTSLTTIAGLTPIIFETSLQAQFLIPMATSIVFGLGFGTVIILLLVPCILSVIESSSDFMHQKFRKI